MKKITVLLLACVLVFGLTGCSSQAKPYVEDMMDALADNDVEDAIALMHPDAIEEFDDLEEDVEALCALVDGRDVEEYKQKSINKSSKANVGGESYKEETGVVELTMDDGSVFTAEYTYWSSSNGSGLMGFYLREE